LETLTHMVPQCPRFVREQPMMFLDSIFRVSPRPPIWEWGVKRV